MPSFIQFILLFVLIVRASHGFELTDKNYLLGGIQVNEPDHQKWVSSLQAHGMNTVSITTYANSGGWNTDKLYYREVDEGVTAEIKAAKESGLRIVFIPRVALDHAYPVNNELWHGMIMPKSDEELRNWFETYQAYLLKWAKVAEEEKIEVFAIGSELKALTHTRNLELESLQKETQGFRTWYETSPGKIMQATGEADELKALHTNVTERSKAYLAWAQETYYLDDPENQFSLLQDRRTLLSTLWQDTIKKVREVYTGELTYAANFDTYHNISFWADLDIMGINAYFQLRTDLSDLSQATLNESWESIMADIRAFKDQTGISTQPVIFTELGYTYRQNCSVEPWSYGGQSIVENNEETVLIDWDEQPTDYNERFMCLTALQRAAHLPENSFLRGLLYWKLSTIKEHEEIENFVLHIAPETVDKSVKVLREIFQTPED